MIKWLFLGSVALFLFSIFFHNIIEFDQDLGRHLLMGKIITETGTVPQTNLLSYSQPNFTYINSHWLSEVTFYSAASRLGVVSLLYLKVAVMLAAFLFTVYTAYKFSGSLAATAVAVAFFSPVLLERTEIRPEIFSYLFIAIFLHILISYHVLRIKYYGRFIWLLPIMEVVWTNSHIYFILGPVLVAVFYLQRIWESYKGNKNLGVSLHNTKYIILNAILVLGATLLNPNGLTGALYPLNVFNNYGYSIVENQNIFFLREVAFNPNIFYFGVAVLAFAASFLLTRFRLPTICYLLAALVILPFLHIRSFPLLFLIELPVFAYALAQTKIKDDWKKWIVVAVIGLTFLRTYRLVSNQYYLSIGSHKEFGAEIAESGKGAVDFVLANKLHGPIFNNFDVGSYLDYRLYPTEKVFIDGRPEAYSTKFFQNLYIPMQVTAENFAKVDDIFQFNLIIFSYTDATPWGQTFLQTIVKNEKFEMVYLDDYAVVFIRKGIFPEISKNIHPPKSQTTSVNVNSLILF